MCGVSLRQCESRVGGANANDLEEGGWVGVTGWGVVFGGGEFVGRAGFEGRVSRLWSRAAGNLPVSDRCAAG